MRLSELGFTLFLGLLVAAVGAVAEGVIFREPRQLWSAQLFQWFSRSSLALWWRDHTGEDEALERRVQLLISFVTFFMLWLIGAALYVLVQDRP